MPSLLTDACCTRRHIPGRPQGELQLLAEPEVMVSFRVVAHLTMHHWDSLGAATSATKSTNKRKLCKLEPTPDAHHSTFSNSHPSQCGSVVFNQWERRGRYRVWQSRVKLLHSGLLPAAMRAEMRQWKGSTLLKAAEPDVSQVKLKKKWLGELQRCSP